MVTAYCLETLAFGSERETEEPVDEVYFGHGSAESLCRDPHSRRAKSCEKADPASRKRRPLEESPRVGHQSSHDSRRSLGRGDQKEESRGLAGGESGCDPDL